MEALDGNAIAGHAVRALRHRDDHHNRDVRPLRNTRPGRRARRVHARSRDCRSLPPLRKRGDGPRPDSRRAARRLERVPDGADARRILKSDRRARGPACPPKMRHGYHEQYQSEPRPAVASAAVLGAPPLGVLLSAEAREGGRLAERRTSNGGLTRSDHHRNRSVLRRGWVHGARGRFHPGPIDGRGAEADDLDGVARLAQLDRLGLSP